MLKTQLFKPECNIQLAFIAVKLQINMLQGKRSNRENKMDPKPTKPSVFSKKPKQSAEAPGQKSHCKIIQVSRNKLNSILSDQSNQSFSEKEQKQIVDESLQNRSLVSQSVRSLKSQREHSVKSLHSYGDRLKKSASRASLDSNSKIQNPPQILSNRTKFKTPIKEPQPTLFTFAGSSRNQVQSKTPGKELGGSMANEDSNDPCINLLISLDDDHLLNSIEKCRDSLQSRQSIASSNLKSEKSSRSHNFINSDSKAKRQQAIISLEDQFLLEEQFFWRLQELAKLSDFMESTLAEWWENPNQVCSTSLTSLLITTPQKQLVTMHMKATVFALILLQTLSQNQRREFENEQPLRILLHSIHFDFLRISTLLHITSDLMAQTLKQTLEIRGLTEMLDNEIEISDLFASEQVSFELIKMLSKENEKLFSMQFLNKVKDLESLDIVKAVEVCQIQRIKIKNKDLMSKSAIKSRSRPLLHQANVHPKEISRRDSILFKKRRENGQIATGGDSEEEELSKFEVQYGDSSALSNKLFFSKESFGPAPQQLKVDMQSKPQLQLDAPVPEKLLCSPEVSIVIEKPHALEEVETDTENLIFQEKYLLSDQNDTEASCMGDDVPVLDQEVAESQMTMEEIIDIARFYEERNVARASTKMKALFQHPLEESDEEEDDDLPQVFPPYLPPIDPSKEYTLVLDLDETLIHFEETEGEGPNQDVFYMVRPGVNRFLTELSMHFEIVIYTAALQDYADWIVNQIDQKRLITHRLYRQHTQRRKDYAIKDLTLLGRDLAKTLIIDNIQENFEFTTPNNGLKIKSWYDDLDDTELDRLIPFLKKLVLSKEPDIRTVIERHKECLEEYFD